VADIGPQSHKRNQQLSMCIQVEQSMPALVGAFHLCSGSPTTHRMSGGCSSIVNDACLLR
jgi:hypothetical protein